jgi:transposase, IS6 family
VDSSGATLDFLLSAKQDAAAAKRFLTKALGRANHPTPRVINTDNGSGLLHRSIVSMFGIEV